MKPIAKILLLTTLFLLFNSPTKAQESSCDINISPQAGPVGTEFSLNLTNCNPPDGTYLIDVLGNTTTYLKTHNIEVNGGTGSLNIFDEPAQQGDYSVSIYYDGVAIGTRELYVQATEASCKFLNITQIDTKKNVTVKGSGCEPAWTDIRVQIFDETGTEIFTSLYSVNAGEIDFRINGDMLEYNKNYTILVKYLDITLLNQTFVALPNSLFCNQDTKTHLNTAIGCIPIKANTDFLRFLLQWSIGVAGGFAVLLILYASFLFITSSGDKYKLQSAKQLLTAAIAGLLFLIFSVFILRVIGVDILGINQLIQ